MEVSLMGGRLPLLLLGTRAGMQGCPDMTCLCVMLRSWTLNNGDDEVKVDLRSTILQ